jgi:hypothetical protein
MRREKTPTYKTLEWLKDHGCAYDQVEQPAAAPDPVDIWIDSTPLASWLFRITAGQPAFYLWAQFSARDAAVHLAEVWFELRDAPDIRFALLPCPGPKREPYRFPDGGFEIPQEQVVNAFFPGTLYRHHPLEGYLMGLAFQPLPHRLFGKLVAELSVVNEFGQVAGAAEFDIALDPNEHGKRCIRRKGKGLYELDDYEEQVVPEIRSPHKPFIVPRTGSLIPPGTARQRGNNGTGEIEPGRGK